MDELKSKYNCCSLEEADELLNEKTSLLEKKKKSLQSKTYGITKTVRAFV